MKISKINFMIPPQLKKLTTKNTSKVAVAAVPFVTAPLVAYYTQLGTRNSLLVTYRDRAIREQRQLLNDDKISQSTYNDRVSEIKDFYNDAMKEDADVTAQSIQQNAPSFKGNDYDVYSGNDADDDCCDSDSDDDCCDSDSDSDDVAGCATSSC